MRNGFIVSLFLCLSLSCLGQASAQSSATPSPMKLMVRIEAGTGLETFKQALPEYLRNLRCVDKDFRLYSIELPPEVDPKLAVDQLNRTRGCMAAQQLHTVRNRYTPSDTLKAQQVYLNIIKAYMAWDYIQGPGVNRRGDTLVMAIIDDGLDTLQPDLAANVWKNHNEIPWNGIDDDGNGYKDDYWGWNGGDSNNRVLTAQSLWQGHGTSVAGVMGAKGDNVQGIAGVVWNAKIMPLLCYPSSGSDAEIGVVRCMLYAMRMKKLYISSGGKKGANIVAANFSIGIDKSFPSDVPIWCAMYDSLGSVGILSAGATTDVETDVDKYGDIPTTCPSPFLITVSYTNNSDQRMQSGYSPTQVDMAAPGQDIYTTIQRKDAGSGLPYALKSGTSFSTPLITGTIALLYNNLCDTFLALQKKNNDSALHLLKQWILKGTDTLAVLNGKCLTSGRLNLYKVWQQMNNWCSVRDIPYAVKYTNPINWLLFPNPVNSGSTLNLVAPVANIQYEITDATGRIVCEGVADKMQMGFEIKTGNLSQGFYIIRCNSGNAQMVRKLQVY